MRTRRHHTLTALARLILLTGVVCLLVCATARGALAQAPDVACVGEGEAVRCKIDLRTAFSNPEVVKRLKSGFLNTLLYRVYIRRVEDDAPVALTARLNRQRYELWDEVYYIYPGGARSDPRPQETLEALLANLAKADLEAAKSLPSGAYYADVIVELNPLSEAEEAEFRSWIARSRGGHRTFATGDRSFFGTFVSLFINIRPGSAERTFRYQSPVFRVGAP